MKSKSLTFVLAICCMSLVLMAGAVLAEDDMMMDEMMAPQVCMGLPSSIMVSSGSMGIQCQQVSGGGIGVPSLAMSAMNAVDVWGPLGVDAEVCFSGAGSLTFLDATMSPRMEMDLDYSMKDGMTCGHIMHPGTVVLVPGMMMMDDMMMDDDMMHDDMMMDDGMKAAMMAAMAIPGSMASMMSMSDMMMMDDMMMDDSMMMDDMMHDDMMMDDSMMMDDMMHDDDMMMDDGMKAAMAIPGSMASMMGMDDMMMDDDMMHDDMMMDDHSDDMSMDMSMMMDDMESMVALEDCEVTAQYNLNLRDAPGGAFIGTVPGAATVAADGRTEHWFHVEHGESMGWISASYVNTSGDCG